MMTILKERSSELAGTGFEPAMRGLEPAGMGFEPAGRASELVEGASKLAERTPDPAGRASEPAEMSFEPAGWVSESCGRALDHLSGRTSDLTVTTSEPAESPGGWREKDRLNGASLVCGGTIGHRRLYGP